MIQITDINGRKRYLSPDAIASITESGPNSHGIRSIVKLFDKSIIESQESADQIATLVDGQL